jgi:L-lactate dehydrogenase complex protein LldE
MMRSFYPTLENSEEARRLAARTFELSQFLVDVLEVKSLGRGLDGIRIAYHHGCHALRELGVDTEPTRLLRGAGAEVIDWEADKECCGFGGLFSTKFPEVSGAMADRKLDTLPDVDFVVAGDGGCLLQLSGRSRRRGTTTPFRHLASVLWQGVGA